MAKVIHSGPDILGETPVFVGTRVPVQSLFDYLESQHPNRRFSNSNLWASNDCIGAS